MTEQKLKTVFFFRENVNFTRSVARWKFGSLSATWVFCLTWIRPFADDEVEGKGNCNVRGFERFSTGEHVENMEQLNYLDVFF